MPQTIKERVLNYAANRWGLNKKRCLGPTSDSIRECNPASKEEWIQFYYSNVKTPAEIDELGRKLYFRISVTLPTEEYFHPDLLCSISEQECINYMHYLAIDTPWMGFARERGLL